MHKQLFAVVFSFIFISGCGYLQPSADSVVLDLDAIANATGQAAIIKQQISNANEELNSQLNTIASSLNEQLANEKKKMESKPVKDSKVYLEQLVAQANQKMQESKVLASQKSQQYQAVLIQQLRQEVAPIAEKIARERGATIVVISNNATLWFDPTIDITDEIISEMRANPLQKKDSKAVVQEKSDDSNADHAKE